MIGDANVGGAKKEKNIFYKQCRFKKATLNNLLVYKKNINQRIVSVNTQ